MRQKHKSLDRKSMQDYIAPFICLYKRGYFHSGAFLIATRKAELAKSLPEKPDNRVLNLLSNRLATDLKRTHSATGVKEGGQKGETRDCCNNTLYFSLFN